jgi:RNA polymerase sigma-70 factor (ECF subfamily)
VSGSIFDLNSEQPANQYSIVEDDELIASLREGCEQGYETLLARFQQPVYNLAFRLLNDSADASDVVQEVFLKVFRNVGQVRSQSSLKTWIYRITVNEAHNQRRWFFRHRHREVGLEEESEDVPTRLEVLADSGRSPFDYVFDREKHILIEEALCRNKPTIRAAGVRRDNSGLSDEEIAEVVQISLGTVKSRILRGREALRQELTGRLEPEPNLRWVPKTAE